MYREFVDGVKGSCVEKLNLNKELVGSLNRWW